MFPSRLPSYLIPAAAGASAGFRKPLYFISTGYGAAVALQAVSAIASGRFAAADALGRTHLAALAAYGVRLAGFVLWRDNLPSYQKLKNEHDAKIEGLPLGKKLGMWVGCSALYWAMFVPAFYNSAPAAGIAAAPAMAAFSKYVAAPLMIGSLVLEAVADYQQQMDKERQAVAKAPARPCMSGVWRYSRQANYLGEGLFWLANYGAAVRSFTTAPQALGAAIGTAAITAIIVSETARREKQREGRYGGQPFWEEYKRDTAQIVPFCHWINTGTPNPEDAGKPEKFRL